MVEFVVAEINNKKVSIPIGLGRPKFKLFNVFEQWYAEELAHATSLKERLEAGESMPHSIKQEMINWSKQNLQNFRINLKLNTENQLNFLDMKIKMALRKYDCDIKQCLVLLKQLKRIRFTPLVLKKNPGIIKTVGKIRRFRGKGLDQKEVEKIKKYGHQILKKMSATFNVTDQQSLKQEENNFYQRYIELNITSDMMTEDP